MARRNNSVAEEREDNHIRISNDVANTPAFFDFVLQVMNSDNEVDTEALQEAFGDEQVRTRTVGYGNNKKELKYVPSKFIKERLNSVLDCKYSFFVLREERVTDPLPRYNREEDTYVDSDCYIKVTGCLVIMGLGVQVAYGVKKTYGYGESDDWKAAATDAFKKCCSMFGIEADYDIEDDVDDEGKSSGGSNKEIDLDDVEYDDDSLAEALETEITFGKFKNLTLEEIYEEDPTYIEWLMDNARDDDVREASAIVLKYYEDEEGKSKKSAKSKSSSKKSSSSTKKSSKSSSRTSSKPKTSSKKKEKDEEEVDDERQELIDSIEEIFEEEEYDDVTKKQLIQSVSTNKKSPKGKTKLSQLTERELSALLEVLVEDDEDDDE